jgi:hypothetical protein
VVGVVNVLCDRALEEGYRQRKDIIDTEEVLTAARQVKVSIPIGQQIPARTYLTSAAAIILLATGGWWAYRSLEDRPAMGQVNGPAAASDVQLAGDRLLPAGESTSAANALLVEDVSFTVVVASFRIGANATALANQVAALGLPAFTRLASDWHQVLVGPYVSEDEAAEARRQLEAARITDTRIVTNVPERSASSMAQGGEPIQ